MAIDRFILGDEGGLCHFSYVSKKKFLASSILLVVVVVINNNTRYM